MSTENSYFSKVKKNVVSCECLSLQVVDNFVYGVSHRFSYKLWYHVVQLEMVLKFQQKSLKVLSKGYNKSIIREETDDGLIFNTIKKKTNK